MICNSPIILKKWSVNTSLQKEEMTCIPIWVKLHDVPIPVFEEDGISLIASYLGKPIMLDSYTTTMCKESWGRSSFARCLIEINSEAEFTESITIGVPEHEGPGFIKETIHVEYEWKPPRRNNKKNATSNTIPRGVPVAKGFQVGKQFNSQPKAPKTNFDGGSTREATSSKVGSSSYSNEGASHKVTSIDKQNDKDVVDTGAMKISNISSPNPFTVMGEVEDEDEDIENVYDESENLNLNHNPGEKDVRQVVNENNLSVYAILESHVHVVVVYDTCNKVCSRWKWTSNGSLCDKGYQTILGWNDDLVDVMIMAQTNQVMNVQVNTRIDNKTLFCSFIYTGNYYIDRRTVWNNLVGHAGLMRNRPWVLLGDFNAVLNIEDHYSGGYEPNNQKPKGSNRILKKIDRIKGNLKFNDDFPGSFAIFQPYRISDHSPCVLRIPMVTKPKPKPSKFSNFLVYKEGFHEIMDSGWNVHIEGYAMYQVVKRLKGLKSPFRKLLHNHGNLHDRVNKIRIELDEAQKAIDRDPSSSVLHEEHAHYLLAFKEALLDEERFLQQKAKVPGAFVKHYNQFLGAEGVFNPLDTYDLFIRVLDNSKADCMVRDVTNDEIKSVMIFDNILLTQELMRNYHRRRGPPRWSNGLWFVFLEPLTLLALMVMCMAGLRVRNSDEFQYHHLCEQQRIINLCFADDLFLFSRGHPSSVSVIMDALDEFKQVSSLVHSIPKSTAYFCNVPTAIKASILNSMSFTKGVLPVRIEDFNIALMATHIWSILTHRESLWVKWVHTYKLKGRSFWDLPCRGDASWGWLLLLYSPSCHSYVVGYSAEVEDIRQAAAMVWSKVCVLCGMDAIPPHLSDVVAFIVPLSKGKTVISIISRIVVAATSYYIWLERNGRLFKKKTATPGQIVDLIFSTVRLKLVTFKFKKMSTKSRLLLDQWKIPSYCIVHDGSTR
ncbi:RNA-directed DNA polymerase, eukaryota, reverse transcriptase zinc-binding domain protein [Tanacetum coccineum]